MNNCNVSRVSWHQILVVWTIAKSLRNRRTVAHGGERRAHAACSALWAVRPVLPCCVQLEIEMCVECVCAFVRVRARAPVLQTVSACRRSSQTVIRAFLPPPFVKTKVLLTCVSVFRGEWRKLNCHTNTCALTFCGDHKLRIPVTLHAPGVNSCQVFTWQNPCFCGYPRSTALLYPCASL